MVKSGGFSAIPVHLQEVIKSNCSIIIVVRDLSVGSAFLLETAKHQ
jgi:hypothetical protein